MSNKNTKENECMLCGNWKEEKSLVCRECFQKWYKTYGAERIEENPLIKWVLEQAKICSTSIAKDLEEAKNALNNFKENINQKAYNILTKGLKGTYVPHEDFSDKLGEIRQTLWNQGNGDKLYGCLKRSEYRAENLPNFVKTLETKIEQYEEIEQQKQEQ